MFSGGYFGSVYFGALSSVRQLTINDITGISRISNSSVTTSFRDNHGRSRIFRTHVPVKKTVYIRGHSRITKH